MTLRLKSCLSAHVVVVGRGGGHRVHNLMPYEQSMGREEVIKTGTQLPRNHFYLELCKTFISKMFSL